MHLSGRVQECPARSRRVLKCLGGSRKICDGPEGFICEGSGGSRRVLNGTKQSGRVKEGSGENKFGRVRKEQTELKISAEIRLRLGQTELQFINSGFGLAETETLSEVSASTKKFGQNCERKDIGGRHGKRYKTL